MSYSKSILKSTSIIGAAQVINIFFSIIQSKVVAVLLGPNGTGFISVLQSSVKLFQNVAGLGIENSAVRDIAKSNSLHQNGFLAKTVKSTRRIVLITSTLGFLMFFIFSKYMSIFMFGNSDYVLELRVLSFAVCFNLLKGGQTAIIQGLRKIKYLAYLTIIGAFMSTVIAIPILYFWGMDGVSVYLVLLSLSQLIIALVFSRRMRIPEVNINYTEIFKIGRSMINLGLAFMIGSLLTVGVAYLIRVFIIREFDLFSSGIYQAAFALSGVYINVVLKAMGKDFYPQLASVSFNSHLENRMINEQIRVGVLFSAPGLLLTLAVAPIAIRLFYTPEYYSAYYLLQWMVFGVFLKTISWPMGYLFIARSKTNIYMINQVVSNSLHIGLLLLFVNIWGFNGTAYAFTGLYLLHSFYLAWLARRENKFVLNKQNMGLILLLIFLFVFSLFLLTYFNNWISTLIVLSFFLGVTLYSYRKVKEILNVNSITEIFNKIKKQN